MPVELISIPLNSGARQDLSAKLMPDGLFRVVENGRLRRTGELGPRLSYTALPTSVQGGGTLRAWDLASHNDALIAFGSTDPEATGPERLFTFNEELQTWVAEPGSRPRTLSAVTELREVFRPPYTKNDEAQLCDLAFVNGHIALVYESHEEESNVHLHIANPETGSVLFSATIANRTHPRVVAVGSVLVACWRDGNTVRSVTFEVGTSTALSAESALFSGGTLGDGMDLAQVDEAGEFCLLVIETDGTATVRRFVAPGGGAPIGTPEATGVVPGLHVTGSLVSEAGALTTVAGRLQNGNVQLSGLDTSTLSATVGPTAIGTTGDATGVPSVARRGADVLVAYIRPDVDDTRLVFERRTEATHSFQAQRVFREISMGSKILQDDAGRFAGVLSPRGKGSLTGFHSLFDLEHGGDEFSIHRGVAIDRLGDWIPSTASDGAGQHYVVSQVTDLNCSNFPVVMGFRLLSPERRQTAALGGHLFVAGGYVAIWDGVRAVEAGFFETPEILEATASAGAGELESEALYVYAAAFDWWDSLNRRHLSPVSDDFQMTTGVGENTGTVRLTAPETMRRDAVGTVKVVLYRTRKAPDKVKRRAVFVFPADGAETLTLTDLASDAELLSQEVVYTQGQRGTLSGPLQHESPEPAEYLWPGRERIVSGGLPDRSRFQLSKRAFPSEPLEWSSFDSHFGTVAGRTTAVFSQDDSVHVATRNRLFIVGGTGPDDSGVGEFAAPRELPGNAIGVVDWRSVVATAEGVWFRADPDRLHLLPRGGGAAQWLAQAVRETLEAYPEIRAAAVCSNESTVGFVVADVDGGDGRIVSWDTRSGVWYVDTLDEFDGLPPLSLAEHLGRLVAVDAQGVVHRQDQDHSSSPPMRVVAETGAIDPAGVDGWARLKGLSTTGVFLGPHEISVSVSFEDQNGTFLDCTEEPVRVDGPEPGVTVELPWYPPRRKGNRFTVRIEMSTESASEGQLLNHLQLEVVRKRKASRKGLRRQ